MQPLQVFGCARPSCYWIGVGGRPLQAVSTNLDVRQLTDAELIDIILEGQAMRELPALEPAVGVIDDAAEPVAPCVPVSFLQRPPSSSSRSCG